MSNNELYEKELAFQADRRRATVEFIKLISDLWYDNTVELILFRNVLLDRNVSEILNLVEYASEFVEKPISIFDAVEIAREIKKQNLPPSKIDIGKLVYEYHLEQNSYTIPKFVEEKLKDAKKSASFKPKDVVLYGFGRIGRLLARELMVKTGKGKLLRLRAIVTRGDINETILEKRASLLRNDSVHGDFHGTVGIDVDKQALVINGTTVFMISANNPEEIDYTKYGISDALVIDNTGAFRDEESLGKH
ncbi:MAG TPA: glyceraldehyde 3-phosphate dehydrogenase NAD-binding domain-containing protein, partial [Flavobacteriaceae bacterium]|nr:glyceraldehyde 3-phosphate dehydrogenase NAD-binding domain-containing protein [Flavobacteriaceae bacterium]